MLTAKTQRQRQQPDRPHPNQHTAVFVATLKQRSCRRHPVVACDQTTPAAAAPRCTSAVKCPSNAGKPASKCCQCMVNVQGHAPTHAPRRHCSRINGCLQLEAHSNRHKTCAPACRQTNIVRKNSRHAAPDAHMARLLLNPKRHAAAKAANMQTCKRTSRNLNACTPITQRRESGPCLNDSPPSNSMPQQQTNKKQQERDTSLCMQIRHARATNGHTRPPNQTSSCTATRPPPQLQPAATAAFGCMHTTW